MTTVTAPPEHPTRRRTLRWSWLLFAAFSVTLAIVLGIVTSDDCTGANCSATFAGGPIGWVAISALLAQATWATLRAFRGDPKA